MVLLGLDIGTKRIGVAKSDELGMFAHGLGFIERTETIEWINVLNDYICEYTPDKIIVGMPVNLDGTTGVAAENIQKVITVLKGHVAIAIEEWDERLTSKQAMRYMEGSAMRGKKKKKKVDSLAAQIMLQDYLDFKKGNA